MSASLVIGQIGQINPGYFPVIGRGIGAILLYAVLGTLLMVVGFYAVDLSTPGRLRAMVRDGRPNAVVITAFGMVSMAFIVVTAIWVSSGNLVEGLIASLVFGLLGIVVQVGGVRLLEYVTGIDIGAVLADTEPRPAAWVVAAAHVALGLVVAVAII